MMDLSVGVYKNTYKTKIDNHEVEIEINNFIKPVDFITIWWSYDNNNLSTDYIYSVAKNDFYVVRGLTEKQKQKLVKKIKEALEMQNKM